MNDKEYRMLEGISRSELWKIRESPEKFKYSQEHPEEQTPALLFGSMVHKLVLEPDSFEDEYAVAPEVDRRTKDGKAYYQAFLEANGGKTIITSADFEKAGRMAEKALQNDLVKHLLVGEHEKVYRWVDSLTGEACKVKVDCVTRIGDMLVVVDYKSTSDASTDGFMRSAVNYGYDFQAAMYSEAIKCTTGEKPVFVFIAQEKTEPFSLNIMQADDVFVKHGYDIFRELIGVYHDCKQTDNWYGYLGKYDVINNLSLPVWLAKEVE